ncbi:MAG: response regulator [Pseudomonadales bacterium]|nr:response regulator [Pseudomonadales bacterium]
MTEESILKLQRDRKILRRIDSELSQESLPSVVGYFLVFALLVFPGDLHLDFPKLTIIAGAILMLLGVARLVMVLRFEQEYAKGPARWRKEFFTILYVSVAMWSVLQVALILHYGMSVNTYVILMFTVCLCGVANANSKAYVRANKINMSMTLLPAVVAFALLDTVYSYLFSGLLIFYFMMLWMQSAYLHRQFWEGEFKYHKLKLRNRDMEVAMTHAKQARDVKIEFINNLTHEIRTPMNSVLGMLSLLGDTELKDNQKEFQTVATHAGESLLRLIDDILDFSAISSGKLLLDSNVINLRKCIDETLETLSPVAHAKGVELSCVYDKGIPARVRGDGLRIGQIIQNLVNNAIKFSQSGEVIVEIHLKTIGQSDGMLRVHVSDRGVGVAEDMKNKIFDVFSVADSSSTRSEAGTGLGLAISRGLVDCMNGEIGLISREGEGSTFWFTIPLRLSSQQAQYFPSHRILVGKKVLIVDAPSGMVRSLSNELESWEVEVESIEGYDKALQVLRSTAREGCGYDLVILNMGLQYVGSFKLSRIIAEDPLLKETRQLILSTLIQRGSTGASHHAGKVGSVLFVTKPSTQSSLYLALVSLFGIEHNSKSSVKARDKKRETNPYKILLVEDNKVNQMVAKGMLTRLGFGVKVVNNGKEALGIIEDKVFDLILMDCHMPELDGYDATHEIRSRETQTGKHIPIVAMTANAMDGEEARCLAAGMDDYLSKPVNVDELESKLRLWLGQRNSRDGIILTGTGDSNPLIH